MREVSTARLLLMLGPLLAPLLFLFSNVLVSGSADRFTLADFQRVLYDSEVRLSLGFTAVIALVSSVVSTIGGLGLALLVRRFVRSGGLLYTMLQAPLAIPHLAIGLVLIHLLSPSGLIARLAYAFGLITVPAEFPELINDRYGIGIVIGYVVKEVPFLAVMTLAVLIRTGAELDDVARTLGASRGQRLRYITLPAVRPALLSASIFVFAYTFSAFEAPFLLGRAYPAMLPIVAQRRYMIGDATDRSEAIAIGVMMSVITALCVWMYLRLSAKADGPIAF
jgi:putative spermidine/putrescine transport system permease protein